MSRNNISKYFGVSVSIRSDVSHATFMHIRPGLNDAIARAQLDQPLGAAVHMNTILLRWEEVRHGCIGLAGRAESLSFKFELGKKPIRSRSILFLNAFMTVPVSPEGVSVDSHESRVTFSASGTTLQSARQLEAVLVSLVARHCPEEHKSVKMSAILKVSNEYRAKIHNLQSGQAVTKYDVHLTGPLQLTM